MVSTRGRAHGPVRSKRRLMPRADETVRHKETNDG